MYIHVCMACLSAAGVGRGGYKEFLEDSWMCDSADDEAKKSLAFIAVQAQSSREGKRQW